MSKEIEHYMKACQRLRAEKEELLAQIELMAEAIFRFTLNDDRTARCINGLIDMLPDKRKYAAMRRALMREEQHE